MYTIISFVTNIIKWSECLFKTFSNIKLIVLKIRHVVLCRENTKEINSTSFGFPGKKNGKVSDDDRCNIASYEKKTIDFFFSNQFFFLTFCVQVTRCALMDGKQFLFIIYYYFLNGAKSQEKKVNLFTRYLLIRGIL
jgi:hypothetical protein